MSGQVLSLAPGVRLMFDGELVEIVELSGPWVGLRAARTGSMTTVTLARFMSSYAAVPTAGPAQETGEPADENDSIGTVFAALSSVQREEIRERAGHVREVLTGFRSGHEGAARPGEPRAMFTGSVPLSVRCQNKALELGVSARTVQRWLQGYRAAGEAGLVDPRSVRGGGRKVDPRWDEAVRLVLSELVDASTPTRSAVIEKVYQRLESQFGAGVVPIPSRAAAYRRLAEITKGTNAVTGSAKGRRSIAARPQGAYGRLRATRPGEYVVLDTQDLDVFAMEPITCRWVRVQLTVAQDLFTRCILGLRVTPISTKAVDVAGVLYDVVVPSKAPADWPQHARWPYHGVPSQVVFDENDRVEGGQRGPVCAPETLVVDHGKVFLSAHVISVCTRLGISIQPAQPHKPTDKPTVERFFKSLREGLIQHLPAYKGPDIHSRGERLEQEAFLFVHEVEDVIREWVAGVYHPRKHDGLSVASLPHLALSPNEMFEIGVAKAGILRIPLSPDLAYDFLPVAARTIQHYGVEVGGLRYNGPALDSYRNTPSPYGGRLGGKWPIRVNPDDVRYAYFQDPADCSWHRLEWEHAPTIGTPFSDEAARHARRLAIAAGDGLDPEQALRDLLARWDSGVVSGRRERHAAVRLAGQYAPLRLPVADPPSADNAASRSLPGIDAAEHGSDGGSAGRAGAGRHLQVVGNGDAGEEDLIVGDDDEADDLGALGHDPAGAGEDFYADAFEIIE